MQGKNKEEIKDNDFEKDNYHESEIEKKDSLMWSEEDYDAMQKLTGFDEESILEDQRKGTNILLLVLICIICLFVGIFIGYNIQPKKQNNEVLKEKDEISILPQGFYTRLNNSNELYLYELSNVGEEISILDLSNSTYKYDFIDNYLYLLILKDGLKFYRYEFTKQGYRRDLVKIFDEEYDSYYFENGYIVLKKGNNISMYDLGGLIVKSLNLENAEILSYNKEYLIYSKGKELNVIDLETDYNRLITKNMDKFLLFDNENLCYIEESKIYRTSVLDFESVEIMEVKDNKVFIRANDYYLFNDGKTLYVLTDELKKTKDFDYTINEISYIDRDNVVIVLSNYDAFECVLKSDSYYLFNINSKSIIERNINGCLNNKVINEFIKVN